MIEIVHNILVLMFPREATEAWREEAGQSGTQLSFTLEILCFLMTNVFEF